MKVLCVFSPSPSRRDVLPESESQGDVPHQSAQDIEEEEEKYILCSEPLTWNEDE